MINVTNPTLLKTLYSGTQFEKGFLKISFRINSSSIKESGHQTNEIFTVDLAGTGLKTNRFITAGAQINSCSIAGCNLEVSATTDTLYTVRFTRNSFSIGNVIAASYERLELPVYI